MSAPEQWVAHPDTDPDRRLPPDLTPDTDHWFVCHATHPEAAYVCTRLLAHTGRHAAGNGDVIVAVWR